MNEQNEHDEDGECDQQKLSALLRQYASRHRASPALTAAVQTEIAMHGAGQRKTPAPPAVPWRSFWFGAGGFAAGVAASMLVFLLLPAPGGALVSPERDEVLASHVRALMASHLTDVASSDQHTVKPWFQGKLDYSPPVQDLATHGFPLIGGRLDYLARRPVAALVYRRNGHFINLFIWPETGDNDAASSSLPLLNERQGYHLLAWRKQGMRFWAVSDLNPAELQSFGNLLH